MMLREESQSGSLSSTGLQILVIPENKSVGESERIGCLVNTWLVEREKPRPNARVATEIERKLHDAIKVSSLRGKILTFAGLNLWVNDSTPNGVVESQEAINL